MGRRGSSGVTAKRANAVVYMAIPDILKSYRLARDKKAQIQVLADLNCTRTGVIEDIINGKIKSVKVCEYPDRLLVKSGDRIKKALWSEGMTQFLVEYTKREKLANINDAAMLINQKFGSHLNIAQVRDKLKRMNMGYRSCCRSNYPWTAHELELIREMRRYNKDAKQIQEAIYVNYNNLRSLHSINMAG